MKTKKEEIGERIKILREKTQMNQKQFAELIGIKTQYLSNVEKGLNGITIDKLIKICNITGATSDYIIFGTNSISAHQIQKNFSKYTNDEIYLAFEIIRNIVLFFK